GKGLKHLIAAHPERCVEARGYGLLRGLELTSDDPELLGRVVAACRERGLLINGIAGKVLRMTPPLTIERGHVRFALDVLDEALAAA
ncbi:MAG: aminotransferase class III-fold pyridoxal phosphate-dependent enzyme, partial [Myxococcota bacterium]|nr:aminotransferase class III-fold pyridoxal phosphate-dependent enzyme [Myxococcota bacterium]